MQNRLSTPIQALRGGRLLVQYRSGKGELDVWFERRVLSVERFAWKPQIVETKGVPITLGVTTIKEYRTEVLTIHYLPRSGHLDVWHRRKVLTIDRWRGPPEVTHYVRGEDWEDALEEAAK